MNIYTQSPVNFGQNKIPRYIYHITSKNNYTKIVNDAIIKPNEREVIGKCVFAVELTNLFKRWKDFVFTKRKSKAYKDLITHASKNTDSIVILRIPTVKLDKNNLFVRSQNRLDKFRNNPLTDMAILQAGIEARGKFQFFDNDDSIKEFCRNVTADICEKHGVKDSKHCIFGDAAKRAPYFKNKKEAIEYVYKGNITDFEKIGEINIGEIDFDSDFAMKNIFTTLLKNTPEVKGAEMLKC